MKLLAVALAAVFAGGVLPRPITRAVPAYPSILVPLLWTLRSCFSFLFGTAITTVRIARMLEFENVIAPQNFGHCRGGRKSRGSSFPNGSNGSKGAPPVSSETDQDGAVQILIDGHAL
jgi:hypothetical protein